ncbi:hypothetical protein DID88_002714 [Monilinia fructigena]|uniref:Uncharacterized protein n=1 Tax=Monilinia fructigena TaxID=38457 RepID=A0A395IMW7_9HELO|nr:hypothetical protein DID88_002714 [Monilinia fructigena]
MRYELLYVGREIKTNINLRIQLCIRAARDLTDIGDLEYVQARDILKAVKKPEQLHQIETNSPQIKGEDAELWQAFIAESFPLGKQIVRRNSGPSLEEREQRLRAAMASKKRDPSAPKVTYVGSSDDDTVRGDSEDDLFDEQGDHDPVHKRTSPAPPRKIIRPVHHQAALLILHPIKQEQKPSDAISTQGSSPPKFFHSSIISRELGTNVPVSHAQTHDARS